jgi:hypothetical protein
MPFGSQPNAFFPSLLSDIRRQCRDRASSAVTPNGAYIEPVSDGKTHTKETAKRAAADLQMMVWSCSHLTHRLSIFDKPFAPMSLQYRCIANR